MNENGNPRVPIQEVDDNLTLPNFTSNLGVIPTSYKDSMDFYETLNWLVKYLENTIIPAVNKDIEAVEELEKLFEELRAYVDTFAEDIASKQPMITQDNPLASDLVSTANQVNKFVTQAQLILINSIPNKEDVANRVEEITEYSTNTEYPTAKAVYDLSLLKEDIANKVTAITSASTNTEYPSAKAVYDQLLLKEDITNKVNAITSASTNIEYPSAKAVYDVSENLNSMINDIYNVLPRVSGTGSTVTLNDTAETRLDLTPIGNCEQDTTAYVDVGTWEQGTINTSGIDVNDSNNIRTINYLPVIPNVLYNISRSIYTKYMAFRFYDSNKTYLGNQFTDNMVITNQEDNRMGNGVASMTMTIINTNIAYMRLIDNSNDISTQYTISTQAPTPYYPKDIRVVTGDNEFVVQNKNLFDKNGTSSTNNATRTILDTGVRVTSGSSSGACYVVYTVYNIKPNTNYTIKCNESMSTDDGYAAILLRERKDGENLNSYTLTPTDNVIERTITTTATTNNIRLYFYSKQAGNGAYTDYTNIQLEPSSTATSYVPHAEQKVTLHLGSNYLAGIDTYKDEIVGKKDDWKIVRKVGKVVLDGTENWNIFIQTGNYILRQSDIIQSTGTINGLCNKLQCVSRAYIRNNLSIANNMCCFTKNELVVSIQSITSASDFKTWLASNNLTCYYILETPTEETITDNTLISDLNNMYQAMGYDGQTNISIIPSTGSAQGELYVSTLKKIS